MAPGVHCCPSGVAAYRRCDLKLAGVSVPYLDILMTHDPGACCSFFLFFFVSSVLIINIFLCTTWYLVVLVEFVAS